MAFIKPLERKKENNDLVSEKLKEKII